MAQAEKDLGLVRGATGAKGTDAKITSATATATATHLDSPKVSVEVGGQTGAQTLAFTFTGLQGAKGDKGDAGSAGVAGPAGTAAKITSVKVTVDKTHLDQPTCTASISGDAGNQTLTLAFVGLMGATGAKGTDGATGPAGPAGPAGTNATTTATATQSANGLMSSADKKKLDTITGGGNDSVVIADGSILSVKDLFENNVDAIREAIGYATSEHSGLVPSLPE